jgi:hypothetical protein
MNPDDHFEGKMDATDFTETHGTQLKRTQPQSRARLVRRVLLLQVKLLADGLRDLVMMPLSLAAAAFGLVSRHRDPEIYLDRLMYFGRETDRLINLFDHEDPEDPHRSVPLDRVAEEIEAAILRDYENGGLSSRGAAQLGDLVARLRRGRGGAA